MKTKLLHNITDAKAFAIEAKKFGKVNERDLYGNTPIVYVVRRDLLQILIENKADINTQNDAGDTPLFSCQLSSKAQFLLNHGANPYIRNYAGLLAIDIIKDKDIRQILLTAMEEIDDLNELLPKAV